MNERTHIDLFSGIGGFSLAARANGVRTVIQCESDKWRVALLERSWQVPIWPDVRTFDGTKWRGCWLLTSGTPCQPASRAGKQRGEADDRWLWGEALRIVAEAKPRWCLFENPPGIDDVGLGGIISELGRLGYEVGICSIPACAVNSPQDRERYWIICKNVGNGQSQNGSVSWRQGSSGAELGKSTQSVPVGDSVSAEGWTKMPKRGPKARVANAGNAQSEPLADGDQQRTIQSHEESGTDPWQDSRICSARTAWEQFDWLHCHDDSIRRVPTGFYSLADGLSTRIPRKLWSKIIAALGDSIVWPVAAEIIGAMIKADSI